MIERLVYRSHAVGVLPELAADRIFQASVANNRQLKITGALGFFKLTYVQLLEGPAPALDELLKGLQCDVRHTSLRVLLRAPAQGRLLPGWSMARLDLGAVAPEAQALLEADDGLGLIAYMASLAHEGVAT